MSDNVKQYYEEEFPADSRMLPYETLDRSTKAALQNTLGFQAWNVKQSVKRAIISICRSLNRKRHER